MVKVDVAYKKAKLWGKNTNKRCHHPITKGHYGIQRKEFAHNNVKNIWTYVREDNAGNASCQQQDVPKTYY